MKSEQMEQSADWCLTTRGNKQDGEHARLNVDRQQAERNGECGSVTFKALPFKQNQTCKVSMQFMRLLRSTVQLDGDREIHTGQSSAVSTLLLINSVKVSEKNINREEKWSQRLQSLTSGQSNST